MFFYTKAETNENKREQKENKITSKFYVKMFLFYLTLLLEKIAGLFPLNTKLDVFSFLVRQIVHQWETFHLISRRHTQWKMGRS